MQALLGGTLDGSRLTFLTVGSHSLSQVVREKRVACAASLPLLVKRKKGALKSFFGTGTFNEIILKNKYEFESSLRRWAQSCGKI